ncbi:MAG: hypothetical protein KAS32_30565, partial [Candidatus Peribacteraceae bacterium]|nr:hypothetical protein [Candidatus Peribacteraceae bacterium]
KESGTGNTGWVATGAAAGLWEVSGGNTQLIIPDDINFQNLKAIAMACDNGATLPTSGLVNGQWFLHTPTGREILYMYSSTDAEWKPIMSIGDITVFVDKTDGTDALTHGQAINTNAFATIQFAFDSLPPLICGNVIININGEAYIEDTKYRGRIICGAYTIRIVGTMTETLGETTATGGTAGDGTTQGTLVVSGAGWGVGTVEESGTTDGTTANKLIESGQNFTTTVGVGMVVYNTTDTTQAHVTTVDSDTQLSLSADIMVSGEAYQIGWGEHTNLLIRFEADTTTAALRGMSFRIDSNTSDTLVAYGAFFSNAPVSGDTFKILSHNTTLTNNTTTDRAIGVFNGQKGLVFEDIEFNDKAGSTGVDSDGTSYQVDDGAEATFKYCKFEPNATGAVLYFVSFGVATMLECFLNDGRTGGARMAGAKDGGGKLTIKHCKVNGHPTTGWGFYGQNNGTLIYAQAIAEDCNWGFLALNMGLVTSTGTSAVNGGTYVRNNDNGAHASSFSFVADTLMIFDNNTTDRDFPAGNTDPSVIS